MKCPNCGEQIKAKKGMMNFCGFCGTNLKTGEKSWAAKEPAIASSLFLEKSDAKTSPSAAPVSMAQQAVSAFTQVSSSPEVDTKPRTDQQQHQQYQYNNTNNFSATPQTQQQAVQAPQYYQTAAQVPNNDASGVTQPPQQKTITPPPSFVSDSNTNVQDTSDTSFYSTTTIDTSDITEQIDSIEKTKHTYEPVITIPQKNIEIHSQDNDSSENFIPYMEYTRSSKEIIDKETDNTANKFSSYSFVPPVQPMEEDNEADKVSEVNEDNSSASTLSDLSITNPEVNVELPEPQPEPEPEPPKETIINFIGQNKTSVESMLRFKGINAQFTYVTDETKYDTVISQSIPAGTEVLSGTEIKITVSAGTWSEWSENTVPASSMRITETKNQCRRRTRTRTTDKRESNTTSGYDDYNLVDTTYRYSNWVTDQYFTADVIPTDDTCEIVTKTVGFKYAGWFNPTNISAISFSTPDVANFFNNNLSNIKWMYDETITEQNVKPDVKNWRLANDSMIRTPAGDSLTSNIFFSAHVINGKSYAMKFGSSETEWYIYKRRSLEETTYHYEKEIISDWTDWTDWADQEYTASEDCEVETRTLSRSRRKNSSEL